MSESKSSSDKEEDLFGNSSLDHALLESLFYTEMMHMNDGSNVLSNQLLSSLTADGDVVFAHDEQALPVDPQLAMDHADLLGQVGVQNGEEHEPRKIAAVPQSSNSSTTGAPGSTLPRLQLASPGAQVSSLTASLLPELVAPQHTSIDGGTAPSSLAAASATVPQSVSSLGSAAVAETAPAQPPPSYAYHPQTEEEKRSKLVHQFATLASRLGITLPTNVLQSLSQVAGTTQTVPGLHHPPASSATTDPTLPPTVQQLAATAEAAVASVGRKRPLSESPPQVTSAQQQSGGGSSSTSNAAAAKRRKKPRLVECEQKLGELKAENAMLKRHLANLSAQSQQLEQDRQAQEQRMRQMAAGGSTEEELEQAIQTFQDMYSDYGRRRHSEINFHLDQLLRLANPTNFTKMGLWTMGQQSKDNRNPIASILQKELGISPQQGKKIVEQREKIRSVCDNIKEVRMLFNTLIYGL
jgi:hypothetical protein